MISPWPRRISYVAALLIATATAGAQNKRPMTFTDIMELKNVGGVALSPDGSRIAYAVSGWEHPSAHASTDSTKPDTAKGDKHEMRSHLWMVPAAGGTPRQLTFGERVRTRHSGRPTDARSPSSPHVGPAPTPRRRSGSCRWTAAKGTSSRRPGRT